MLFCSVYQEVFCHFPAIPNHFGRFPKTTQDARRLPNKSKDYRSFPARRNPKIFDLVHFCFPVPILLFIFVVIFTGLSHHFTSCTLYKNSLFIIEIGYNAQQIWQINIIPSVSLSFTFLKLFLYTLSIVCVLNLVRVLYSSVFYTDRVTAWSVMRRGGARFRWPCVGNVILAIQS